MINEELSLDNCGELFNRLIYTYETSSTQNILKERAHDENSNGIVAAGEVQSAGRGRQGRRWEGVPFKNLTFSFLIRPKIHPSYASLISLIAGMSVKDTIEDLYGIDAELKWPNDVLINGKKVCGIISESACSRDKIFHTIVGIGLNVNMTELPQEICSIATSLAIESGKILGRSNVLNTILRIFTDYLNILECENGENIVTAVYAQKCGTIGRDIRVILDSGELRAHAVGITGEGALIAETKNGREIFTAADVVHIRF